MLYMVIEKFHTGKVKALYERFEKEGRLMPEGVRYVNSWTDKNVQICFQLMESESREKLLEWIDNWKDYASFKVVPVLTSQQAKEKVLSK